MRTSLSLPTTVGRRLAPVLTLSAVAFLSGLSTSVHAQDVGPRVTDDMRSGVHFSIGIGGGSASVTCPGCQTNFFDDRLSGVSGLIQLGGFVTPQLALTAEFSGWVKNDDPIFRRVASLGISLLGYPDAQGGFFVKGSIGGIRAIGENDLLIVQTDGWMATTGIGYDIPAGETLTATVYANYVRAFGAGTWINGVSSDVIATPNLIQMGVGLTVH